MRIPSGKVDQSIFFVAEDTAGARKTGLSSFTVYRSRNAGTATIYTTPTVVELSAANMPGVYALLIDEDTTIASASDSEEYCVHITATGMLPVSRTIELYRRDTTTGNQLLVDSNGRADIIKIAGTTQTARDIGASVLLSSGAGTGQLDFTSGIVKSNATQILGTAVSTPATAGILDVNIKNIANAAVDTTVAQVGVNAVNWRGGAIPAVNVTGVPLVDNKYLLGTIYPTPTVAGIPNVNVKTWNDLTTVALPLVPTTAGRTLDVSATGEAGLDWANVGSPTTAQNFSATFIQGVNSLAAGTDSVSTVATSGSTLTTGSAASGTYASTKEQDSVYWQIADAAGTLDMYFEFDVGSLGVPTAALWIGGLTTAVDSLKVFAYNWGGAAWEQVGLLNGTSSLIVNEQEYNFTTAHVGTGGNIGLVRLRFQNTGLVSANFYTDRVLCSYTNVYSFPSNFSSLAIDGSGRIDLGEWLGVAPLALTSQLVQVKTNSLAAGAITAAAIATDAIDADALASDAVTEIQSGLSTLTAAGVRTAVGLASANLATQLGAIQGDTDDIQTRIPAVLISGRMDASVGAMAANVVTASAIAADAIGASELAADAVAEIVDGVWDEAIAGHLGVGTTGEALNGAGAGGNPWISVLEGTLTAGDLLRVTAGVAAGKDNIADLGGGAATVTFRDAADTTTIVTATMAGSKRTAVVITP